MNKEFVFLKYPVKGETVKIQTERQKQFKHTISKTGNKNFNWKNLENSGKEDETFPEKCVLRWETKALESVVEISENLNFKNASVFKTTEKFLKITNLKANKKYYWRVNGCLAEVFKTEDVAPRWIETEGLTNIRDIGNWETLHGKKIKQGLIFRGSEMNSHHNITENGIKTLKEVLKIKTDLDIREEKECKIVSSPLGTGVEWVLIPAAAYGEFLEENQKQTAKKIFEILADSSKYPIYLHCWGGADRTGTIAFLLGAVLDVSFNNLITDYELTSLSVWGDRSREAEWFKTLLSELEKYGKPEESINKKAVNYLISCGIKTETINKIKQNLLENK